MFGLLMVLILGFISGLILMFLYTQLLDKGRLYFGLVILVTSTIFFEIAFLVLAQLPETPVWVIALTIPYILTMSSSLSYLAYIIINYRNMQESQKNKTDKKDFSSNG